MPIDRQMLQPGDKAEWAARNRQYIRKACFSRPRHSGGLLAIRSSANQHAQDQLSSHPLRDERKVEHPWVQLGDWPCCRNSGADVGSRSRAIRFLLPLLSLGFAAGYVSRAPSKARLCRACKERIVRGPNGQLRETRRNEAARGRRRSRRKLRQDNAIADKSLAEAKVLPSQQGWKLECAIAGDREPHTLRQS